MSSNILSFKHLCSKIAPKHSAMVLIFFISLLYIACGGGGGGGSDSNEPAHLAPPSIISASDAEFTNKVVVSWNHIANAKSYNIYRAAAINGTYEKIGNNDSAVFEDTNVMMRQTYFYKVSTLSQADTEGEKSQADSGYADDKPGIITVTAANGTHTDKVSISWNSDASSTRYKVLRSRTVNGTYAEIGIFNTTSCEDTTITPGLNYFYKVQGGTDYPTWGPLSTHDNGYANLETPSVTASQGTHPDRIAVTWNNIPHETSFRILRSTAENGTYSQIATPTANTALHNDSSTTVLNNPDVNYFYKVQPVSEIDGPLSSAAMGYIALPYPAGITASDGLHYQHVKITWNSVTGATSYNVYRSQELNGTYSKINASTITTPNYVDATASGTTRYFYKVSAIKNRESQLSNADEGYRKDSAANSLFRITWQPNREKAVNSAGGGYRVYYNQTGTFNSNGVHNNVPYVSGSSAPTQCDLPFTSTQLGTWYIWVVAYSSLDGTILSQQSARMQFVVE